MSIFEKMNKSTVDLTVCQRYDQNPYTFQEDTEEDT